MFVWFLYDRMTFGLLRGWDDTNCQILGKGKDEGYKGKNFFHNETHHRHLLSRLNLVLKNCDRVVWEL